MKIRITYINIKHYNIHNIGQWMWFFHRYKNIRGFIIRILGVYINITEDNATEKLIEIFKNKQ